MELLGRTREKIMKSKKNQFKNVIIFNSINEINFSVSWVEQIFMKPAVEMIVEFHGLENFTTKPHVKITWM